MNVTLITPTADRPAAWPHIERWMARQSVRPTQWIVADDGECAAPLTMGQTHIRRPRTHTGGASLAHNILAALPHVTGEAVLVIEDDDYYLRNHVELNVHLLRQHAVVGCRWLNYYNLQVRGWMRIKNACAALCNTALRASALPLLTEAAQEALDEGIYHVDRLLWRRAGYAGLHDRETVVGMKGLPGMPGIGIGHKRSARWNLDRGAVKLREWLGQDARYYGVNDGHDDD